MLLLEGVSIFYKIKTLVQYADDYCATKLKPNKKCDKKGKGSKRELERDGGGKIEKDPWAGVCTTGTKQSPIDIKTEKVEFINVPPLNFEHYRDAHKTTIKNTGYGIEIEFPDQDKLPMSISGSVLSEEYAFQNICFHWHSEHTIDGHSFPLEAHFIHYLKSAGDLKSALSHSNGIVVLGVFYEVSDEEKKPSSFKEFENLIPKIENNLDKPLTLETNVIPNDLLPVVKDKYYAYEGALTLPECNEVVQWIVFSEPSKIGRHEYEKFKDIKDHKGVPLLNNARPVQDLNDRLVSYSPGTSKRAKCLQRLNKM